MKRVLFSILASAAASVLAGSYTASSDGGWSHSVASDGSSNTYRIVVPAGFAAAVSLEFEGPGFATHHVETSTFSQYVNGSLKTLLDQTTEFLSDTTIRLSASCTPAVSWTEIYPDRTFKIAGVTHYHYHHQYHFYDDAWCRVSYRLSVSYVKLLPDLVVSELSLSSADAAVDEPVSLSFTVRNAGRKNADAPSVARIYDGAVQIGGDIQISALAAGGTETHAVDLPVLSVGMHELRVEVDSAGAVAEASEQNNASTVRLRDYARTPVAVTFDTNGGDASVSLRLIAGGLVGSLPVPTRRGYDFAGWWTEKTGGYRISETEKITMDRAFFAHWTAKSCAIEFNRQGGSGGDGAATAAYDSALPVIVPPSRTGYAFDGYWSEPNGGGTRYYDACGIGVHQWDIPLAAAALYAKWIGLTSAVAFETEGFGRPPAVTAVFGSVPPKVAAPTRSGWRFMGYFSSRGGEGLQYYDAGGSGTRAWDIIGESVTLYAHWLPVRMDYTLALEAQGGSGGSGSVVATYASEMRDVVPPTRAQYAFGGYYTAPNGGGAQYYDAAGRSVRTWDLTPENGRLYAKWTKAHHVVLDSNGGGGSAQAQYFTAPIWKLQPNTFSRSGYVFAGWALEADGAPVFADGEEVSAELLGYGEDPDAAAITLYAAWGRKLTTALFPGVEFVTGGSGADTGWRVEDGLLRSSPATGISWLCTVLDRRGTLEYSVSHIRDGEWNCSIEAWFSVPFGIRRHVNDLVRVATETINLASGDRHLATWSVRREIGYLLDWCGYSPTGDSVILGKIVDAKHAAFESVLRDLVFDALKAMGCSDNDYNRERCARAARTAFDQILTGKSADRYCDRFISVLAGQEGFNVSGIRSAVEWRSGDPYGERVCSECDTIYGLIIDLCTIETFVEGYAVLDALSWRGMPMATFIETDDGVYPQVKADLDRLEALEFRRDLIVDDICAGAVGLLESRLRGYVSLSDDSKRLADADVREAIDSYFRDPRGTYQQVVELINGRLSRDFAHGDILSFGWTSSEYERKLQQDVISLCADVVHWFYEIRNLEDELATLGVVMRKCVSQGAALGSLPVPERGGYRFDGWWTFPSGGTRITETTKLSSDAVFYAHWTARMYHVAFDSNGGSAVPSRSMAFEDHLGALPVPERGGFSFAGWYDARTGGTAASIMDAVLDDYVFFAQWTKDTDWASAAIPAFGWAFVPAWTEPAGRTSGQPGGEVNVPIVEPSGAFEAAKARTDNGVLMQDGAPVGILQVKVGKESKGESKVSVTVIGLDGKKYTAKAVKVRTGGTETQTFEVKKFGTLTLTFGANGFSGSLNGAVVTSVDATSATTDGKATFTAGNLSSLPGILTGYLPQGEAVTRTEKKWTVKAKAGKLKYVKPNAKKDIAGGLTPTGSNIAGLKLTYAAKTQTFKGSFKVWTFDSAKNKLKSVSAKVTGVVVNGAGYGQVMVKKDVIGELTVK